MTAGWLRSVLASDRKALVGDGLQAERDFEAVDLGPGEPIRLLLEEREQQSAASDDLLDFAIDVVTHFRLVLLPSFFDQAIDFFGTAKPTDKAFLCVQQPANKAVSIRIIGERALQHTVRCGGFPRRGIVSIFLDAFHFK